MLQPSMGCEVYRGTEYAAVKIAWFEDWLDASDFIKSKIAMVEKL